MYLDLPRFQLSEKESESIVKNQSTKYLKISQVPNILPVCQGTVKNLVDAGVIPSLRVGRNLFVPRDGLQKFIDKGGGGLPPKGAAAGGPRK